MRPIPKHVSKFAENEIIKIEPMTETFKKSEEEDEFGDFVEEKPSN